MHYSLPLLTIAIRSLKASAYDIQWVVNSIALFILKVLINSHAFFRLIGSIPVVGSSIIINRGLPTPQRVRERRLFIPPLNPLTWRLDMSYNPTNYKCEFTRLGTSFKLMPFKLANISICYLAVNSSQSKSN